MSRTAFLLLVLLTSFITCSDRVRFLEFPTKILNVTDFGLQLLETLGDSDEGMMAAIKMIDASSKIPTGILNGNFYDLGDFDECLAIKSGDLYGKYCLGSLNLYALNPTYAELISRNLTRPREIANPQLRTEVAPFGIFFAVCIPSNWSAAQASQASGLVIYTEDYCNSKATQPELSTGAIATIAVLLFFLVLVVLSTTYDVILYYTKWKKSVEILVAFSFLSNGRKIFRTTTNPDQLLCLNGIKTISMMWVVIGHEFANSMYGPMSNFFDVAEWINSASNMYILNATLSVDTFFVVGGLVTVYTFMKATAKGAKFNLLLFYVHRYLRLTPALVIMCLIHMFLINYFSSGPNWKFVDLSLVQTCETGWWSTILYITNYVQEGICVPQTWYLSVDMQLYFLSPIVLLTLYRYPKVGVTLLGILTVAGVVVPFAIGYAENIGTMYSDPRYMNLYYLQTYTRFGPYVIGMLLGYYIYKIKSCDLKLHLRPWSVCVLWLISLTGLVACLYAGYPLTVATEEDRWGNSLFLGFNRPSWAVALSILILLCVAGYGGPIDAFLSLPIFQILTKLSYSIYLIHYAVITVRISSLKHNVKFSDIALMHVFWGDFIFTLVFSVILCLTFESPVIILEKYLFRFIEFIISQIVHQKVIENKI